MIIEGLLMLQEGANPNFIEEKLKGFLSPGELSKLAGADGEKAGEKQPAGRKKQALQAQKGA